MTELNNGISEKELKQFAFDVYYKAISLLAKDGSTVIDIDNDIVDELIKNTLHSEGLRGNQS